MGVLAIDRANLNETVKPADDFYTYANGQWCESNPIPDRHSRWGLFEQLHEQTLDKLHTLLTDHSLDNADPDSPSSKSALFFRSGLDTDQINAAALAPLQPIRDSLAALVTGTASVESVLGKMHSVGIMAMFSLSAAPDLQRSKIDVAWLSQGGLGLPDRDFYILEEKKDIREKYRQCVAKMLVLGRVPGDEEKGAEAVMRIETALAEVSLTRTERRDPARIYHMMSVETLREDVAPGFRWEEYLAAAGIDVATAGDVNVTHLPFFARMVTILVSLPADELDVYLQWTVLRTMAKYLSTEVEQAHFDFFSTVLTGEKEMKPRWQRVINTMNGLVGEMVGKAYCQEHFPEAAKQKARAMVQQVHDALKDRILSLEWMGEETKQKALLKCQAIRHKIGYPDKWIDYATLEVTQGPYATNILRANEFEHRRDMKRVNQPIDPDRWEMPPTMVNAYFHPTRNEICFPAAILQFPFFDVDVDDAVNYGAGGAVIAHELTHCFDDQGRKFDADGNMNDWWSEEDAKAYLTRSQKIVKQFAEFEVHGQKVNGELTQGENIADLGGCKLAFQALQQLNNNQDLIDGFSSEQRFFLSWAQIWRHNIRQEMALTRLLTDPHAPGHLRVNGPLRNLPDFWKAFGVTPGDPMHLQEEELVQIW